MDIVTIVPHTEKSFVVYTNKVMKYQDSLNHLGGTFDSRIRNMETGETFMGWIFYIDKQSEIQEWINSGCKHVLKQGFDSILFPPKKGRSISPVDPDNVYRRLNSVEKSIEILNTKFKSIELENTLLIARLNSLESELIILKTKESSSESSECGEIFEHVDISE